MQVTEKKINEELEEQLHKERNSNFKEDLKSVQANDSWKQLQVEDKFELEDLMRYDLVNDLFLQMKLSMCHNLMKPKLQVKV